MSIGTGHTISANGGFVAGANNTLSGAYPVVSGGSQNSAIGDLSTVCGGENNASAGRYSVVGGGSYNVARGEWSTVAGGGGELSRDSNLAGGNNATVSGGTGNIASGTYSSIGGGYRNTASGDYSVIGGGHHNIASDSFATVCGGWYNTAVGYYSLAAGRAAAALHDGSIVLAASSGGSSIFSGGDAQMVLRADSGIFVTNAFGTATYTPTAIIKTRGGAYLSGNGTTWTNASDRNQKENFTPVNGERIVELLDQLEITEWNYKDENDSVKHIGPVAQDFHALFGLGADDKSISTIDPSGIALVAIQELMEEIRQLKERIAELESEKAPSR